MNVFHLCDEVRQTAYDIHLYLGCGHFEKVYENALAHRLQKRGIEVKQQHPIKVYDEDGTVIGDYVADLLVANELIVELKAVKGLGPDHTTQVLGYLKATGREHGLLLNFGARRFQVKKFVWNDRYGSSDELGAGMLSLVIATFASFCAALVRW